MRRFLTILPLVVALAGCGDTLSSGPPSLPQQGARASFPRGGVADLIRVDALDSLPLRAAQLVAPDGTATPATFLQAQPTPRTTGGSTIYDSAWVGSLGGPGGIPATFAPPQTAAMYSQTEVLLIVSTADLPLPDPVAYRRDWANYRIRLTFAGRGDNSETRDIAAPQPPPPQR